MNKNKTFSATCKMCNKKLSTTFYPKLISLCFKHLRREHHYSQPNTLRRYFTFEENLGG